MGRFRRQDDRQQGLLLPPSPRDWLPEGHLAWFVIEAVEQLNLDTLLSGYRVCGKGELAYPPRVMLTLLIYAYSTGTFSSRRIAAQIEDSVAYRVIAAGVKPSHRTICRFREENLDEFQRLFGQIVQLAQESGLIKMGTLAIDGSKVKANASKHKAMSYDRMLSEEKKLQSQIQQLTQAATKQDKIDDETFGPDFRGDELPEELRRRESRLKTIQAARKRLEERKAAEAEATREAERKAAEPVDQDGPAPSEAREQENVVDQAAKKLEECKPAKAEAKRVAKDQANEPADKNNEPVLPAPRDQENFTDPESRIMPTGGKSFEQCYNAQIAVDANAQIVVAASVSQRAQDVGLLLPVMKSAIANVNEVPKRVLADKGYRYERDFRELQEMGVDGYVAIGREGKSVRAPSSKCPCSQAMHKKLETEHGRQTYRKRKAIVEPVFGWVKQVLGFRAFSLRGLRKVAGEWNLVCLALNLRRMAAMVTR